MLFFEGVSVVASLVKAAGSCATMSQVRAGDICWMQLIFSTPPGGASYSIYARWLTANETTSSMMTAKIGTYNCRSPFSTDDKGLIVGSNYQTVSAEYEYRFGIEEYSSVRYFLLYIRSIFLVSVIHSSFNFF